MSDLILDVRLDGFAHPVGQITRNTNGNTTFRYSDDHLNDQAAFPLSLSLPLETQAFGDVETRAFFANLLQERDQPLAQIRAKYSVAAEDIAGLLYYLGADCAGAISILPEGNPPTKVPGNTATDYRVLSDAELKAIVKSLFERNPLPNNLRDPSPLSGVQSKISLLLLPDKNFAIPIEGSGAPTTHILKVPNSLHPQDAVRESLALQLSGQCNTPTVPSDVLDIAGIPVLVTYRFDRACDENGMIIRLHQEDFAQALGLHPSLKYERNGATAKRFDAAAIGGLLDQTANPDIAKYTFFHATIFDLLIGNVDAHAKNHALLYGRSPRPNLSPRYDVMPTRLDHTLTDELAFSVGGAKVAEDIGEDKIRLFLGHLGIGRKAAQGRLIKETLDRIVPVLSQQLESLSRFGQKAFADLIAANMREILPKLNYDVPEAAKTRDAIFTVAGAWSGS